MDISFGGAHARANEILPEQCQRKGLAPSPSELEAACLMLWGKLALTAVNSRKEKIMKKKRKTSYYRRLEKDKTRMSEKNLSSPLLTW